MQTQNTTLKNTTLLDLITVIDGERRFHQAAALLSVNLEDRAQYAHRARCEATAISRVRRDMARTSTRHTPLRERQLDEYVDSLIDTYAGADGARPDAFRQVTGHF